MINGGSAGVSPEAVRRFIASVAEEGASAPAGAGVPLAGGTRPSARGIGRGLLGPTEEFLREKHEEIEEEERRWLLSHPASVVADGPSSGNGEADRVGEPVNTEVMMIRREAAVQATEAPQPAQNAAEAAEPRKRGDAFGKFRGMLSSTEEFLRRKHEEIEEEERRGL
ncbi:hypothetical protein [Longimicrobium terrae]|uniref:Uncharacterized protein n=1 Tax=Longimicrobium terrae TaxID=1639882 RepID=A0A841H2C4_9BACT|nr:hypothetical protein [Longimicrobium terrae]MBB6072118.1 hypothetical protein [Longimicrobium terrae]NNC29800.1 hypothetical protein [Longimicrobium terrae]